MLFTYVKMDASIKGCVREGFVNCKSIDLVSAAVQYELLDMTNVYLSEKVTSLERSLQNKELSEDEIKGVKKKIEKFKCEIESNIQAMLVLKPKWEYVVENISNAHNEYVKNDECAVRNVLRLTACQKNRRLYKYVVINGVDNVALYEVMERIHHIEECDIDDNGCMCDSEIRSKDYAFSAAEIGKIVKSLFSIPIESELTKKVNMKFNKTDLAYIHSLYVKSLGVRFSISKDNMVTYGGRVLRTLITRKKDKDGIEIYDFTSFYEIISKLAIEYIVK